MAYYFEDFELDPERRELRQGGSVIPTEPQVFDLLEYLVRNRDRVVSRDDMLSAIWNGRHVSDSALSTRINAARTAIGDSGEEQRLIRTFRRKGIRFVANVRDKSAAASIANGINEETSPRLAVPGNPSIVVLPFVNLSDDPSQDYFADGMVDDITVALGRIPWLFVISGSSAFTYKGRLVEDRQVGAELGVRYVLRGSVRKSDSQVRISVQLIDCLDGKQAWADRFDGELASIFEMQDLVAASISAQMTPKLRGAELERTRRKPTGNLTAYDLFLKALPPQRDSLVQSEESLQLLYRVIELDPAFAPAYGLASYYYMVQTVYGWLAPMDARAHEGLRLAHIAAELGGNDPDALWMAGRTMAVIGGEIRHGHALIDRALSLNPNSANAWWAAGVSFAFLGEVGQAIECLGRARRLNPLDPSGHAHWLAMALAYFFSGQHSAAKAAIDSALAQWPSSVPALLDKAAICGQLGEIEEGLACIRRLLAINSAWTVTKVRIQFEPRLREYPAGLDHYIFGLRAAGLDDR